jgi:hypothetical protein
MRRRVVMMNPIGIPDEDRICARGPWFADRTTATSVLGHGGAGPGGPRFGGRDGPDGGAVLEGAAAVERGPVPTGRRHPPRPEPHRPPPTPAPPPAHPTQAAHHLPVEPRPGPRSGRSARPASCAKAPRRDGPVFSGGSSTPTGSPFHREATAWPRSGPLAFPWKAAARPLDRARGAGLPRRGRACISCPNRRGRVGCGRPSCRRCVGAGWWRRVPRPR